MDSSPLIKTLVRNIRPRLGTARRRLRSLPFRTRSQKDDLLHDTSLTEQQRRLLQQVESRISHNDGMYTGNGAQYFKVGLSAIECIEAALDAAALASVEQVLDLPCGHGRVLRFLVQRFPKAGFTASDLDRKGVDFCVQTFGAEGVYSQLDLSEFSLNHQFDLIWCGSLITHLDETSIQELLAFFTRHLLPRGLLVFTTHGERAIQKMLNRDFDYGIANQDISALIDSYRNSGFGFADYPNVSRYGVSLTRPDWIRAEMRKLDLKEVYFREHGWDDHQDVYGFVRQS